MANIRIYEQKTAIILSVLLFVCAVLPAWSETEQKSIPDYSTMMLKNSLLPGLAQFDLGQTREGWLYASSSALTLAGQGLMIWYALQFPDTAWGWYEKDGLHYVSDPEAVNIAAENEWALNTGLMLSIWGSLFNAYSTYSAHRDWMDRYAGNSPYKYRQGRETLPQLFSAPWDPAVVFDSRVFPVFPLTLVLQMRPDDIPAIGRFFTSETVNFMGFEVPPAAGLGLQTLFTFALVTANATAEEVLYRGLSLEASGKTYSTISFGLAHAPNVVLPGASVEGVAQQTVFATLFGLYAADITEASGGDLRYATALHYWHNIGAFLLSYMTSAAETDSSGAVLPGFQVRLRF